MWQAVLLICILHADGTATCKKLVENPPVFHETRSACEATIPVMFDEIEVYFEERSLDGEFRGVCAILTDES